MLYEVITIGAVGQGHDLAYGAAEFPLLVMVCDHFALGCEFVSYNFV